MYSALRIIRVSFLVRAVARSNCGAWPARVGLRGVRAREWRPSSRARVGAGQGAARVAALWLRRGKAGLGVKLERVSSRRTLSLAHFSCSVGCCGREVERRRLGFLGECSPVCFDETDDTETDGNEPLRDVTH